MIFKCVWTLFQRLERAQLSVEIFGSSIVQTRVCTFIILLNLKFALSEHNNVWQFNGECEHSGSRSEHDFQLRNAVHQEVSFI